jgi:hypothetical protein
VQVDPLGQLEHAVAIEPAPAGGDVGLADSLAGFVGVGELEEHLLGAGQLLADADQVGPGGCRVPSGGRERRAKEKGYRTSVRLG